MNSLLIQALMVLFDFTLVTVVVNLFLKSQFQKKLADNESPSSIYVIKAACTIIVGLMCFSIYKPLSETSSLIDQIGEQEKWFSGLFYYHSIYLVNAILGIMIAGIISLLIYRLSSPVRLLLAVKDDKIVVVGYFSLILIVSGLVIWGSLDMFHSYFIPFPEIKGGFN